MKRQTKKQWCKDWISSFGCNNPKIADMLYHRLGGNGKRPDMHDPQVYGLVVNKTLELKEVIDPLIWSGQKFDVPLQN